MEDYKRRDLGASHSFDRIYNVLDGFFFRVFLFPSEASSLVWFRSRGASEEGERWCQGRGSACFVTRVRHVLQSYFDKMIYIVLSCPPALCTMCKRFRVLSLLSCPSIFLKTSGVSQCRNVLAQGTAGWRNRCHLQPRVCSH